MNARITVLASFAGALSLTGCNGRVPVPATATTTTQPAATTTPGPASGTAPVVTRASAPPSATAAPAAPSGSTSTPGFAGPPSAPDPLTPANDDVEHHPERSLLANTELDDPYVNDVPARWTPFARGSVAFHEETVTEKWGRAGMRIEGSGDFTAGVYQRVTGLQPGKWYHAFYATAQKVWGPNGVVDGALPIVREVGVDPAGGTDPYGSTVLWGRFAGGLPDKLATRYGGWKTLGNGKAPLVTFLATGSTVTVFLKVHGWPNVSRSNCWVDSPFLVKDAN